MALPSYTFAASRAAWAGFLVLLSVIFSLGFSCAVPLAAFAAIGALTLGRLSAYALIGTIWLANQITGFAFHHYPLEPSAFAWGGALCAVGIIATAAAQMTSSHLRGNAAFAATAAFLAAFAAYEATLFAISAAAASGAANFAPAIAGRVFLINVAAFAALFLLCRAGRVTGFAQFAEGRVPSRKQRA
jgi:hypothetical protein